MSIPNKLTHHTLTIEDIRGVHNDSDIKSEQVVALMNQHGMTIGYGDLSLMVDKRDYARIKKRVAKHSIKFRQKVMISVMTCLELGASKIIKGIADKDSMDNFYDDLMIWQALKEAGTAS